MNEIRVTLLLTDSAEVANGKLFILGGGWSVTGPGPTPSAVAVLLHVPWNQTNQDHTFRLSLFDADGKAVNDPNGQPVKAEGNFQVGRPPGTPLGAMIDVPLAVNVPPLQLTPGGSYLWRLEVDGRSKEEWELHFRVRSAPARAA